MAFLLDLGYSLGAVVTLPWFIYRLTLRGDRKGFFSRFGIGLGQPLRSSVWLHGSSAGEISLLKPLVHMLEEDMPGTSLVISTYSSTGFATASKTFSRHRVVFFPFDFSIVVARFLRHFDPRLVVIVESEFWPNFLMAARRLGVPVAILNGKISPRSFRIHARTRFVPTILRKVPLLAVQTEEHAQRLRRLGVALEQVRVTGNMKYDLAQPPPDPTMAEALRRQLGYGSEDVVVIGGSLHEREDDALMQAHHQLSAPGKSIALIMVPRYPADAARVEHRAKERGYQTIRKSAIDDGAEPFGSAGVLIVDTVGELGVLYSAADLAFVGGSLFYRGSNKGGHNLMEPAILGIPVLFGPYNFSFKETVDVLLEQQAGTMVHDVEDLTHALSRLVVDEEARHEMGARAREVILANQGATRRNYALLRPLLRRESARLLASSFDTMPRAASDPDSR